MNKYTLTKTIKAMVLCFFVLLIGNTEYLLAQETQEDVSQYFEDSGLQEAKNILRIDFMSIINGDFQLLFEHRITKSISAEIGLGNVSNKGFRGKYPELLMGIPVHDISHSALSYSLAIKFYPAGVPEYLFYSLNHRKRPYLGADVSDYFLGSGYQYIFKKRMMVTLGLGLGLRVITANTDPMVVDSRSTTFFPLQLSFGYIL